MPNFNRLVTSWLWRGGGNGEDIASPQLGLFSPLTRRLGILKYFYYCWTKYLFVKIRIFFFKNFIKKFPKSKILLKNFHLFL